MYNIVFSDSALKQLNGLEKSVQKRIVSALERVRIRPEVFVRKLVGIEGYKLRAGDHRIILDIEQRQLLILVIKIGHRKNVYKKI